MENASKALIIAGSVLISVMLVSLGVLIYNMVTNNIPPEEWQTLTVEQYNAQWDAYCGDNKSKQDAKSLIEKAILFNKGTGDREMEISAVSGGKFSYSASNATDSTTLQAMKDAVDSAKNTVYDIKVTNRSNDGAYSGITITGKAR